MTTGRRPSTPPVIAGYSVGRLLGMGGFADVFLYEQQLPRRPVAVKVLLADTLDPEVLARFGTEADLMARLSHHPSIVTIHQAAVAADGRPYLVMEHCSRPGLGARYRTERIPVAEALRIGIRLASAVETAHRAGILHRDIKPANVLTTDFGWPALTDFGIAATTGWSRGSAVGMSIPWSPPELLAEHPTGDVRADVYSLGATVYALLAGRSPFEVPGGENGPADLIARIERSPLPATGRADVPASLQAAFARAMEKDPVRRFHSALALARALQAVEHELMLPGTPVELAEGTGASAVEPSHAVDDAVTRLRPVVTIDPEGPDATPPVAHRPPARSTADEAAEATRVRPVSTIRPEGAAVAAPEPHARMPLAAGPAPEAARDAPAPADGTRGSTGGSTEGTTDPAAPAGGRRRRTRMRAGLAALVVVGTLAGAAALAEPDRAPAAGAVASDHPVPAVVTAVPSPQGVAGATQPDGSVVFTWTNPQPQDGDRYLWGVTRAGEPTRMRTVDEPTVVLAPEAAAPVALEAGAAAPLCVEVSIVRADRRASTRPAVGCAR
ncbi:serine/threonine-protein kinase [Cellulomonas aerilata]|uniref:non-specific serine/threonine protein kinase n=1 Tax=Cellulomonas aerilata TaxID=515326 RepID=A0A512D8M7_9CELL|nr:serine/threonine-protein kinase [Cellulomonas aerilata]GEO32838.1 hypothetical protein CAE01nite_05630 [Cellulomonas aerilata]